MMIVTRPALKRFIFKAFAALLLLTLIAACAVTAPSRFYTLSGIDTGGDPAATTAVKRDLTVGLGPVVLPKYLDRSEIVRRTSAYEIALAEFDRWSESLETMVPRVMVVNLSAALKTDRVFIFPQQRAPETDYHVEIEFFRFEPGSDGVVVLEAQWELYGGRDDTPLIVRKSAFRQPQTGTDYAATVDAMSRALASLCNELATTILDHKKGG
ncbi:MAG: membrane integrity-associated transporter subunit PqiC [Rhodospirillales bacterium]|nr:membrane integrity-associated transporter subunit PqiC [Rhodospirillales bacterium]